MTDRSRRVEEDETYDHVETLRALELVNASLLEELAVYREEIETQHEELRVAQFELETSREYYVNLFDLSPVGCLGLDPAGMIVAVNAAAAIMFDLPHQRLVQRPFFTLVAADDIMAYHEYMRRVSVGPIGVKHDCSLRLRGRGGSLINVGLITMRRDLPGDVTYLVALLDVSEQQLAEQRARDDEARTRAILNATPSSLITVDDEWMIQSVNSAAAAAFDSPRELLVGLSLRQLIDCPDLFEVNQTSEEANRPRLLGPSLSAIARTPHGRTFSAEMTVASVTSNGRLTYVILLKDSSEQFRFQEAMLAAAEREQRRIGRDLHDSLSQELMGVSLLARDLERRLDGKGPEESTVARRIADALQNLVTRTRRLIRGLYPIELETRGLIEALRVLAAHTTEMSGIPTELRQHGKGEVSIPIDAATHLYRVVQEAVNNAVRHGRPGSILIRAGVEGDRFELTVVDDGLGLRRSASSGMGLRIMRERANLLAATLAVESQHGHGTTVRCVLPLRK